MNLEIQPHRSPNYAPYQKEIFLLAREGRKAPFDTDPEELERQAKESLSKGGWLYVACNAGVGWTEKANREGELASSFVSMLWLTVSAFYR